VLFRLIVFLYLPYVPVLSLIGLESLVPAHKLQGNQKVSVHLMITIQKVTGNVVSPARLQTFIDTYSH
jgi:hypothetical protein